MRRILLSAFEPFGDHDVNASAEVARALAERSFPDFRLATIVVPTVRYDAPRRVIDAIVRIRPDAVVMLGIAANRAEITPERIAINVDDFRIPDNAGNQPVDEQIVADAPAAYFSTLPIKQIVDAIRALDIPSAVSNSAGTYICNHTSFAVLHHLAHVDDAPVAGFVHIPQMREAARDGTPSLPLADLVRGVEAALATIAG